MLNVSVVLKCSKCEELGEANCVASGKQGAIVALSERWVAKKCQVSPVSEKKANGASIAEIAEAWESSEDIPAEVTYAINPAPDAAHVWKSSLKRVEDGVSLQAIARRWAEQYYIPEQITLSLNERMGLPSPEVGRARVFLCPLFAQVSRLARSRAFPLSCDAAAGRAEQGVNLPGGSYMCSNSFFSDFLIARACGAFNTREQAVSFVPVRDFFTCVTQPCAPVYQYFVMERVGRYPLSEVVDCIVGNAATLKDLAKRISAYKKQVRTHPSWGKLGREQEEKKNMDAAVAADEDYLKSMGFAQYLADKGSPSKVFESVPGYAVACLVQVLGAAAVYQRKLCMVHNDLTANNILVEEITGATKWRNELLINYKYFGFQLDGVGVRFPFVPFLLRIVDFGLSCSFRPPAVVNLQVMKNECVPPVPNWFFPAYDVLVFLYHFCLIKATHDQTAQQVLGIALDNPETFPTYRSNRALASQYFFDEALGSDFIGRLMLTKETKAKFGHLSAEGLLRECVRRRVLFPVSHEERSETCFLGKVS